MTPGRGAPREGGKATEPVWPDSAESRCDLYNATGRSCLESGDLDRAEDAFAAAVREAESIGPADLRLATSLTNLAQLRCKQEKYDEGEQLFRRAIGLHGEELALDHPHVALSLNHLARLCFRRGEHAIAGNLLLRLLAIKVRTAGSDHPEVAAILSSLMKVRHAEGRYEEAELFCRRVLMIRERTLPPNDPGIAITLDSLAEVCAALGKHDEGIAACERALNIRTQSLGAGHPSVESTREMIRGIMELAAGGGAPGVLLRPPRSRATRRSAPVEASAEAGGAVDIAAPSTALVRVASPVRRSRLRSALRVAAVGVVVVGGGVALWMRALASQADARPRTPPATVQRRSDSSAASRPSAERPAAERPAAERPATGAPNGGTRASAVDPLRVVPTAAAVKAAAAVVPRSDTGRRDAGTKALPARPKSSPGAARSESGPSGGVPAPSVADGDSLRFTIDSLGRAGVVNAGPPAEQASGGGDASAVADPSAGALPSSKPLSAAAVAAARAAAERDPGLHVAVAKYERAINARSLAQLRAVYPHITSDQEQRWRALLEDPRNVQGLQARISASDIDASGEIPRVRLRGAITFRDHRNVPLTVSYTATALLRRESAGWRFLSISESMGK